jgi:predicted  nucleic acid-binding Zn-ribbon protein
VAKRPEKAEVATAGLPELVEGRLDELYRDPPEEFVARRDELTRELRAEGDPESAAAVKRLRRPSAAAWVINRISSEVPDRTREFVRASERLAETQERVLAGEAAGEELRAAAADEREQIDALVADARRVAAGQGGNVAGVVERVAETLRAAGGDAELRRRVLRGRVEKEQSAATVGIPGGTNMPKRPRADARAAKLERARRELGRLRDELAQAEARRERDREAVAQAEEELRRAKSSLSASKRAVRELERRVSGAESGAGTR